MLPPLIEYFHLESDYPNQENVIICPMSNEGKRRERGGTLLCSSVSWSSKERSVVEIDGLGLKPIESEVLSLYI